MLIIVYGHIGVGKSTLASLLAQGLNATLIRFEEIASDIAQSLIAEAQLDAPVTDTVYHAMHGLARDALQSNRHVVLAGLYPDHMRDLAVQIGHGAGSTVALVEVTCDLAVVKERLAMRETADFDPDDYLQHQPHMGEEHRKHLRVNTTHVSATDCAHQVLSAIPDFLLLPEQT